MSQKRRRKPHSYKQEHVDSTPNGEAWFWHSLSLRCSPAWQARSTHLSRLLDFLEIEWMRHGGQENGRLLATYDQLSAARIGRQYIETTITEGEELGLIEVFHGARADTGDTRRNHANRFRLTYRGTRERDERGNALWVRPTDEWKRTDQSAADRVERKRRAAVQAIKNRRAKTSKGKLSQCAKVNSKQTPQNIQANGSAGPPHAASKQKGRLLSISGMGAPAAARRDGASTDGEQNISIGYDAARELENVRAKIRKRLRAEGRGAQSRLALRAGIARATLSNFLSGRGGVSAPVEAVLRQYVADAGESRLQAR